MVISVNSDKPSSDMTKFHLFNEKAGDSFILPFVYLSKTKTDPYTKHNL